MHASQCPLDDKRRHHCGGYENSMLGKDVSRAIFGLGSMKILRLVSLRAFDRFVNTASLPRNYNKASVITAQSYPDMAASQPSPHQVHVSSNAKAASQVDDAGAPLYTLKQSPCRLLAE